MIKRPTAVVALSALLIPCWAPADAAIARSVTYPKAYEVIAPGAAAFGYITFQEPKSVKYDGVLQDTRSDGYGAKVRLNIGFTDGTTGHSPWVKNPYGAGSEVPFIDEISRSTRIAWVRVRVCTDYGDVEQDCALGVKRTNDQL